MIIPLRKNFARYGYRLKIIWYNWNTAHPYDDSNYQSRLIELELLSLNYMPFIGVSYSIGALVNSTHLLSRKIIFIPCQTSAVLWFGGCTVLKIYVASNYKFRMNTVKSSNDQTRAVIPTKVYAFHRRIPRGHGSTFQDKW